MSTAAAHAGQSSGSSPVVYLAFELGETTWRLGFTVGLAQRPRQRTIVARDVEALQREIVRAKRRFGLAPEAEVVSCYEAGREGFWLHRYLVAHGVRNHVVDSSSIEVNRRARRAKTDRLDLESLLRLLLRYCAGEDRVWSVLNVPTLEQEDARQLHRELLTLKRDRTQVVNRIKGLLATQGVRLELTRAFPEELEAVRLWDGSPLPERLRARLGRDWQQKRALEARIRAVETQRREILRSSEDPAIEMVRQLMLLRGIGINSAWLFVMEFFGWRNFRNRREVGALAGLAPTPHGSGHLRHERGIGKAGNRRVRAMAVEIAWSWLRHQPESALTEWYERKFGEGSKRIRRIGIVALARKLLIELWRYLETGALPEGAVLQA